MSELFPGTRIKVGPARLEPHYYVAPMPESKQRGCQHVSGGADKRYQHFCLKDYDHPLHLRPRADDQAAS